MMSKPSVVHAFEIPSLDGLRAVSFLIVFVMHAGYRVPGSFGVTSFFFLSGFLITTLMRMEAEGSGRVSFGHFYLRRSLRILPPLYLVLLGATACAAFGLIDAREGELDWRAFTAQALHYSNYWMISHGAAGQAAGTAVFWSLAVEEHFYLLFPAFYVLLRALKLGGREMANVMWAICAMVLAWRCVLVFGYEDLRVFRTYYATDTRLDTMLFGCALAVYQNPVLDTREQVSNRWRYAWLPMALLLLPLTFLWEQKQFRYAFAYTLHGLALYPIFISAIAFPNWWPIRWLNASPVRVVGRLSYSLYLVHSCFLLGFVRAFPNWSRPVNAIVSLAVSMATAWAIHLWVEQPCTRLRKRLSGVHR